MRSLLKLKIETILFEVDELTNKEKNLKLELIKYQETCDHYDDDGLSAIAYNGTDFSKDYYKCAICLKDFRGNPHKNDIRRNN